jgi:hypothetical protein
MRHLWSLLAGVGAAPVAWLLLATGQHRARTTAAAWDAADAFRTADLIGPAAVLATAGVLLGVLGTLRWSPAGPIVAGLVLVLPTAFMFADPFRTLDAISGPEGWRLLGQDFAPRLPVENGTLLVLGALLLMAAFSPQRWRPWPAVPQPVPSATDEQVLAGIEELTATTPRTDDQILVEARRHEETSEQPAPADGASGQPPVPPAEEPAGDSAEEPAGGSSDPTASRDS